MSSYSYIIKFTEPHSIFFLVYASAAISTCLEAPDSQLSDRLDVLLLPHNPSWYSPQLKDAFSGVHNFILYYEILMKMIKITAHEITKWNFSFLLFLKKIKWQHYGAGEISRFRERLHNGGSDHWEGRHLHTHHQQGTTEFLILLFNLFSSGGSQLRRWSRFIAADRDILCPLQCSKVFWVTN